MNNAGRAVLQAVHHGEARLRRRDGMCPGTRRRERRGARTFPRARPYLSRPIQAPPQARPTATGATARVKRMAIGAVRNETMTRVTTATTVASAGSRTVTTELARAIRKPETGNASNTEEPRRI